MMMNIANLPLKHKITPAYTLSYIAALLMAGASLAGLFFQSDLYPSQALRQSFVSNDAANLLIGLPILLGSVTLARRGKLLGLLLWPGALFYITYNYLAYAIAMPLTVQFLGYLALVILSVYAIFVLLSRIDAHAVQQRIGGTAPARLAGGVLVIFGALFFLKAVSGISGFILKPLMMDLADISVILADLLVMPTWIIGGVLLWRRRAFGYLTGGGLLFQASMLFVALLVFFILQPFLTGNPFPLVDFIIIFIMGLVYFIPFGLFVRAILSAEKPANGG